MDINTYDLEPIPRNVVFNSEEDSVLVSVKIGNGQIGGNRVTQDETVLAKGDLSEPTFIGKVKDIRGEQIQLKTNVLDVNAYTNHCVITTIFMDQHGEEKFSKVDLGLAPEDGVASFKGKYLLGILTSLLLFILTGFNLNGQNTKKELGFNKLETPASPGFILLDKSPSSIEKPTTPQGFGVGVLGFFQGTGGAMEVAPFWLTQHPNLTADSLIRIKMPLLQNLSVSLATVKSDSTNFLAGGLRTRLVQRFNDKQHEQLKKIRLELIDLLSEDLLDLGKIQKLRQEYVNISQRPSFSIDLASAFGAGSATNSFNDLKLQRWAVWSAFNWRPKGNDFYFTTLARYMGNDSFGEYLGKLDLIDLGVRFNYDIGKFSLSLEYLQRADLTNGNFNDNRVAAIGTYQLSDQFYLTSTLGKNFTTTNNIIALAGINFGFSQSRTKAY